VSFIGSANHVGLSGDFVALSVSDTGNGIPPEILEKVFEPFFTTKEVGAGPGLGLSMVQGFARQSSGSVFLESEVGQGTSVTLYLPRTTEVEMPVGAEVEGSMAREGRVLLVDDDVEVTATTAELLELMGYAVTTAYDAAEAICCFQQDHTGVDILITDFVLGNGLNGIELAAVVRNKRPRMPVLLITGYGEVLWDELRPDGMVVLTKPFDQAALARAVGEAIRLANPSNAGRRARAAAFVASK
jgi:CheY-like chemotaxis protein